MAGESGQTKANAKPLLYRKSDRAGGDGSGYRTCTSGDFPLVLAFAPRFALAKALDATVPAGQAVMLPALAAGALALIIIPTTAIGKN